MKKISPKIGVSIICGVIVLLVAVVLISENYFRKFPASDTELTESLEAEQNADEQNISSDEVRDDNALSGENDVRESLQDETTQPSKGDATESLNSEDETRQDAYDDIFEDKQETTDDKSEDKQENDSNDASEDDDVTKEEETQEKLEESEDTSTGYGPIS